MAFVLNVDAEAHVKGKLWVTIHSDTCRYSDGPSNDRATRYWVRDKALTSLSLADRRARQEIQELRKLGFDLEVRRCQKCT